MLNGQLSTGLMQVLAPGTAEVLGYVFTHANGSGQLQRWLLFRNPDNNLELTTPPPEKARWTLEDWQSNVASLWRPGSYYVWAQTDIYEHGYTYGGTTWDRIPTVLPAPTYPPQGDDFQLDPTGLNVMNVTQWSTNLWGLAYTVDGLRDATSTGRAKSAEYWLLPRGFLPAGACRTTIGVGPYTAESLERFVDLANGLWAPGAVLAITGCKNYFNEVAPAEP